jgi:hypothetical protein
MKYGLFVAIIVGFVALMGGMASANIATSGLSKQSVAPAASSSVKHVGWYCFRRCRWHGGSRHFCRHRCY